MKNESIETSIDFKKKFIKQNKKKYSIFDTYEYNEITFILARKRLFNLLNIKSFIEFYIFEDFKIDVINYVKFLNYKILPSIKSPNNKYKIFAIYKNKILDEEEIENTLDMLKIAYSL